MSKRRNNAKLFDNFFTALTIVMLGYTGFLSGLDASKHYYASMGLNLILAVFWAGVIVLQIKTAKPDVEMEYMDCDLEHLKKLAEMAKDMADKLDLPKVDKHDEHLAEMAIAIYRDVTKGGGRAPTPDEVVKIEAAFHENTDHYARITVLESGATFEIGEAPFTSAPGQSSAHKAAKARGETAHANKPASKLTEQSKLDARNAKRRANRAAKKG